MAEKVILKVVAETKGASKDMNKLSSETKGATAQTTLLGGAMNMVRGAMLKVKVMSKLLFGSIRAGLISTGIGAFLVIIGSLISYFTSTKKGAEMLERALAGFGAVVSVITDRISALGGIIVDAFSNPKKAIADLWQAIKTNVVNRFTGLVDMFKATGKILKAVFTLDFDALKEGLGDYAESMVQVATGVDDLHTKMADGVKSVTDEINEEVRAAIELKRIFQEIADTEREFNKERAQTNQEIAEAQLIAEDESKTLEERVAALQRANELELQTTQKALDLQKRKTEAKRQEVALGESLAEDLDALAEEEIKLINMQTRSFKIRKKLGVAVETLRTEARAKQKAREQEEIKAIQEVAKTTTKVINQRTALEQQAYYDSLESKKELEIAKLFTAKERAVKEAEFILKNTKAKGDALLKLQMETDKLIGALETKFTIDKERIKKKYRDKDALEREAEATKLYDLQQQNTLLLIEDLNERPLAEIEIQRNKELKSVEEAENSEAMKAEINKKYNSKKQAQNKATSDAERKLGVGDLGAAASLFGGLADLETEGTEKWKSMKSAEARINSFVAAQAAFSSMAGIPIVGTAMGIIAAGLALRQGQTQIDAINATEIPKMARGGVVGGYGSGTSDSVNARLSKGEVVINAKSAKMFRGALSGMNVAGGGVAFARGGATTPGEGAGFNGFSNEPLKAFVLTDEMTSSQDRLSKIRRRSSI